MATLADRRERVILELSDSGFSTGMVKNAAATGLLEKALKSLDGTNVVVHQRISESSTQVDRLTKSANESDKSINRLTGRLALFADAAAILGPGLVPIGAVAVPAITGLAAQLGFAAVAGAGFIVAVQGMGDALGAMNKAHLDPTTANLAAARLEMEKLSPAGQDLTRQIFGMRDEWKRLKDVSQGALFPGVSEALDSLETRLPDFERILVNVNTAVGDMLSDGAESLASPRWDDFFTFIATDAPPALAAMAEALGNVAHSMATMWQGFDGLNDDFSIWLVDSTAKLDEWAQGLVQTEGFQSFVDYIRETGPQVADTLGEVALAVVRIAEAAAPLGGPVLAALEGVAKAIGTIAGSDAGTSIMATVTALALLRRGMSGFEAVQRTSWAQGIKGAETFGQRVIAVRSPLLKTSAAMAGIAIASSDTAQGFGLANTASGALLGTMGGPWGAVIGGAVGLMLDITKSTGGFEVNVDSLTATLNQQTGAITANTTAYAANELEKQGVLKAAQELGLSLADVTQASLGDAEAQDRVAASLAAQDAAFFDANGRVMVGTEALMEHREGASLVSDAIGVMSGEVSNGETRIGRMADATDTGTAAYNRAETAAQDFMDAVTRLNNVLSGRAAMRDYEAAVDDFSKSIKDNGRTFDINTEKGRTNQAALDNIANTTLRVAENMKGAARQKFLTSAITDLRTMGEQFGVPKSQIKILIEMLRDANNARVKPTIDVETIEAMTAIERVRNALAGIKDKSVTVRVTRTGVSTTGDMGPQDDSWATGGFTGRGGKYEPAGIVHRGEVVIPQELVKADWPMLSARYGHLPGFADGGVVGAKDGKDKRRPKRFFDITDNTDALQAALDRLTARTDDQTAAVEAHRAALEDSSASVEFWADKMSAVAQSTVAGFNTGLFEKDSNPWAAGAGGGALFNLNKDIAGLEERGSLQAQLAAAGLSGDALAAILSEGTNADLSALLSSGQAGAVGAAYDQRAAAQASVGAAGGQAAYGQQYAAATAASQQQLVALGNQLAEFQKHTAAVTRMENKLATVSAAVERLNADGPERTGRAVRQSVDSMAAEGHRNKRNGGSQWSTN